MKKAFLVLELSFILSFLVGCAPRWKVTHDNEVYRFESDICDIVVKDYKEYSLSEQQMMKRSQKIHKGIIRVCRYFGVNPAFYKDNKITYFYKKNAAFDFTEAGARLIYLNTTSIKHKVGIYVHETVHQITHDWYNKYPSSWIREGIAVYLNDLLREGYSPATTYGLDVDILASSLLDKNNPLQKLGIEQFNTNILALFEDMAPFSLISILDKSMALKRKDTINTMRGWLFYIYAGSFTKYILNHIGKQKTLQAYKANDAIKELVKITGKSPATLILEWKNYLKGIKLNAEQKKKLDDIDKTVLSFFYQQESTK